MKFGSDRFRATASCAMRCVSAASATRAWQLHSWKLRQLVMVSVGMGDVLLATGVMPRAEVYFLHSLHGEPETQARGLQMRQEYDCERQAGFDALDHDASSRRHHPHTNSAKP